jgi:molybdate transport system ATP-binding protein
MIRAHIEKRFPPGPESAGFQLRVEMEAGTGVTVLYGPSGSGKTLTLDSIAGLVTPGAGRIMLDDRILFDAEAHVNLAPRPRCFRT